VSQNVEAFLSPIEGEPPFAILDFGCGPGRDIATFKAMGHRPVGLEGSERFCEMARELTGCEVLHADFLRLELDKERFDGVFCNASLFHVPAQELPQVLTQLCDSLVPHRHQQRNFMAKPIMCDPALFDIDLSERIYIVTGANSGIGLVTARQLAKQGAHVVLACRRIDQANQCIKDIRKEIPAAKLESMRLNLGELASVREFAKTFLAAHDRLDGLVNNAGVMNTPQGKTTDGFEMQLGVNHFGHFLLTDLLLDVLKKSAPSRIIGLSSCYHDKAQGREGNIHFDDLNYDSRPYDGWEAYAQSKLANLLHMKSLAKRLEGTGVTAVSVHPGWVRTNLIRNSMPVWIQNFVLRPFQGFIGMIEPWEGTQTTLHAILDESVSDNAGAFYSQTGTYRDKQANGGGWPLVSPNPVAHDDAVADRFWDLSRTLTGLA